MNHLKEHYKDWNMANLVDYIFTTTKDLGCKKSEIKAILKEAGIRPKSYFELKESQIKRVFSRKNNLVWAQLYSAILKVVGASKNIDPKCSYFENLSSDSGECKFSGQENSDGESPATRDLHIMCQNVRSMLSVTKQLRTYLHMNIFLPDIYVGTETESKGNGFEIFDFMKEFRFRKSEYCVVLILNKDLEFINSKSLFGGRVLIVGIQTPERIKIHLVAVYAPLTPAEQKELFEYLSELGIRGNFILLGDLNCFTSAEVHSLRMVKNKNRPGTAQLKTLVEVISGTQLVPKDAKGLAVITRAVVKNKIPTGAGTTIDHVIVPEKGARHFSELILRDTNLSDHRTLSFGVCVGGGKDFARYFPSYFSLLIFSITKISHTCLISLKPDPRMGSLLRKRLGSATPAEKRRIVELEKLVNEAFTSIDKLQKSPGLISDKPQEITLWNESVAQVKTLLEKLDTLLDLRKSLSH